MVCDSSVYRHKGGGGLVLSKEAGAISAQPGKPCLNSPLHRGCDSWVTAATINNLGYIDLWSKGALHVKRKQSVKNIHVGEGSGRKGMWKRGLESRDRPANQINATLTSVRATLWLREGPSVLCGLISASSRGALWRHPPLLKSSPSSLDGARLNVIIILMMIIAKTASCLAASGVQPEQAEGRAV